MRPPRPWRGLYAITDPGLLPTAALLPSVGAAIAGGARWIQYRHKGCDRASRLAEAAALGQSYSPGGIVGHIHIAGTTDKSCQHQPYDQGEKAQLEQISPIEIHGHSSHLTRWTAT